MPGDPRRRQPSSPTPRRQPLSPTPRRQPSSPTPRRPAVIVDLDGTLCDVRTAKHLYEIDDGFTAFHHACAQCPPHRAVVDWCIDYHSTGHAILIVTGRDGWSRGLTDRWLAEHLPVPHAGVHMRQDRDFRSNADLKRAIHSQLVLEYDIRAAIDDDPEIVGLWLELGIPVAMVRDEGDVVQLGGGETIDGQG